MLCVYLFIYLLFSNEIIFGHLVVVAFIYIETIQTSTAASFGLENSSPGDLRVDA